MTGAPASGKSECWQRLQNEPQFDGFLFFEELARALLREDPAYRTDKDRWHTEIYRRQVAREAEASGKPFVTDRGTVDAFAFHPETVSLVHTSIEKEYERYDRVIQLGSAARLGETFYRTDTERVETIEEALVIEEAIRNIWRAHPGYHFIAASEDYELKYQTLLRTLLSWLA
jgi:predicted ATPase